MKPKRTMNSRLLMLKERHLAKEPLCCDEERPPSLDVRDVEKDLWHDEVKTEEK